MLNVSELQWASLNKSRIQYVKTISSSRNSFNQRFLDVLAQTFHKLRDKLSTFQCDIDRWQIKMDNLEQPHKKQVYLTLPYWTFPTFYVNSIKYWFTHVNINQHNIRFEIFQGGKKEIEVKIMAFDFKMQFHFFNRTKKNTSDLYNLL